MKLHTNVKGCLHTPLLFFQEKNVLHSLHMILKCPRAFRGIIVERNVHKHLQEPNPGRPVRSQSLYHLKAQKIYVKLILQETFLP